MRRLCAERERESEKGEMKRSSSMFTYQQYIVSMTFANLWPSKVTDRAQGGLSASPEQLATDSPAPKATVRQVEAPQSTGRRFLQ